MANILMVVAPDNFRDEELFEPKKVFESAGADVVIASKGVKTARGKLGGAINVDKNIANVHVDDYDAIVFIGGPGASIFFDDGTALGLAKDAYEKGKITAAICIAPSILANAGILKGKKATCFESQQENLRIKGAIYTGDDTTQDGRIITANGPGAATKFGKKIMEALS